MTDFSHPLYNVEIPLCFLFCLVLSQQSVKAGITINFLSGCRWCHLSKFQWIEVEFPFSRNGRTDCKVPLSLSGTDWTILNCQLHWKRFWQKGNLYKCSCWWLSLSPSFSSMGGSVLSYQLLPQLTSRVWLQDCDHPSRLQHDLGALGELNLFMFLCFPVVDCDSTNAGIATAQHV